MSADAGPAHREYRLAVDGRTVNIVDAGAGPAIVLLHGWQMSWHSWSLQIETLAGNHRVVAIDFPGFGASEPGPGHVTIPRYAETVLAVCDQLGLDRVILIGNSLGGFVATEIALTCPHRVEALVLVAAAGMSRRFLLPKALIRHPVGVVATRLLFDPAVHPLLARLQRIGCRAGSRLVLRATFHDHRRISPQLTRSLLAGLGCPAGHSAAQACARHESRHLLHRLDCPTLIVWGAADRLQSVRNAGRYAAAISNARLRIYPDTGHCPQLERPAEFNADVVDFIRQIRREAAIRP